MMEKKTFEKRLETVLELSDPVEAFAGLANLYCEVEPDQREAIRQGWDFNRSWRLPDARTLACKISGLPSSEERIWISLIYNAIEDFRTDFRDNLVSLCVIYHSALEVGLDADALFEETARISSPEGGDMIRRFVAREPGMKSLAAFGWDRIETEDGVIFKGW
jgi:hypothetical protein